MNCTECAKPGATHQTPSGRTLCDDCYRRLAQITGAVSALSSGAGAAEAVGTGLAVGGFAGAADAETNAIRARRAKLAATKGFWRRMYVRIIG